MCVFCDLLYIISCNLRSVIKAKVVKFKKVISGVKLASPQTTCLLYKSLTCGRDINEKFRLLHCTLKNIYRVQTSDGNKVGTIPPGCV